MKKEDYLKQTPDSYNSYYKTYKAVHCRQTGLTMYNHKTAELMVNAELYSKSRAKKCKVEIDETTVYGWYRVQQGYVPLFKRR